MDELVGRLGMTAEQLEATRPAYREFSIPKRSGGKRVILAPEPELKKLQRLILRRVLGGLSCHRCALGFERGKSIVTHANRHRGKAVVVRMDIRDFFPSTRALRVNDYFRWVGWTDDAATLLTRLCTHNDALPQGAPTSPRLSNLVNIRLDARLAALAKTFGATYSRYADDLTFSFDVDSRETIHNVLGLSKLIVRDEGYELHQDKKLRVSRRHDRQVVTGLVVNEKVNLPRRTRRRLRAVEHHLATGKPASLNAAQLAGWTALQSMIAAQSAKPRAIGIGRGLTAPPLPHHRTYGSVYGGSEG
jgi:retron-type reverse transcriptase